MLQQRPVLDIRPHQRGVLVRIATTQTFSVYIQGESDVPEFCERPGLVRLELTLSPPRMGDQHSRHRRCGIRIPRDDPVKHHIAVCVFD